MPLIFSYKSEKSLCGAVALNAKFEAENLSVREVFDKIDVDGSGTIDRNELKKGSAMLGLVVTGQALSLPSHFFILC